MNSRLCLSTAAAIVLLSAVGLAWPIAVPQSSQSIAPLDTFTMEQSIRRLLELDRAKDQVRNNRTIYFFDENYPIIFGDLDGDRDPDAAALVTWEYGGSGWEQRLYVLRNNGGEERWQIMAWRCSGRKLQPETVATHVAIVNRKIVLTGSQAGTQQYSVRHGTLRLE